MQNPFFLPKTQYYRFTAFVYSDGYNSFAGIIYAETYADCLANVQNFIQKAKMFYFIFDNGVLTFASHKYTEQGLTITTHA